MKTSKLTAIETNYVHDGNGNKGDKLTFTNGVEIITTPCWYNSKSKNYDYNISHNYFSICYNEFFIKVPSRKPKRVFATFHETDSVSYGTELERAIQIANKIATQFMPAYKLKK